MCPYARAQSLFSGDTVFIGSVGRLDFPDSDPQRMFHSLQKIKALASTISKAATNEDKGTDASTTLPLTGNDEDIIIYTGHDYGGAFTSLRRELAENRMLLAADFNAFIRAFNDQSSPC